jgi:hypothetical protein
MLKKIRLGTLTLFVVLSMHAQVFAQEPQNISIAEGYSKGNGMFTIVVKDRATAKLDLYVNDKHPIGATVNKQGWATFSNVKLMGTGKISFTTVLKENNETHQRPLNYTEKYTVSHNSVSFSPYMTMTVSYTTTTQPIAFTTTTEQDASLANGTTQVKSQGVNGIQSLTYKVLYTNGKDTNRTLMSTITVTPPVTEVIEQGTYVAPAPVSATIVQSQTTSPSTSCNPMSDEGTCYEPGEYCRDDDQGMTGVAGDGESIVCTDNDGLRWEPN